MNVLRVAVPAVFLRLFKLLFCLLILFSPHLSAQNASQWPDVRPFAPVQGSSLENVSQTNGFLNLHIPLWSVKQHGNLKLEYWLAYAAPTFTLDFDCDNGVGHPVNTDCATTYPRCPDYQFAQLCSATWSLDSTLPGEVQIGPYIASSVDYKVRLQTIFTHGAYPGETGFYFEVVDPQRAAHRMLRTTGTLWRSVDASSFAYDTSTCTLRDESATVYQFGCASNTKYGSLPGDLLSITDSNGNQMILQGNSGPNRQLTDSRGVIIPKPANVDVDSSCPTGSVQEMQWTLLGVSKPIVLCFAKTHYRTYFFDGDGYPDQDNGNETNFEAVGDWWQVSKLVMPTGEAYSFEYPDPGEASPNYIELSKLVLPTGGFITYTWRENTQVCGYTKQGSAMTTGIIERKLYESANAIPAVWTYSYQTSGDARSGGSTDPYGNTISFDLAYPPSPTTSCGGYPHTTSYRDQVGKLVKTSTTEYQWYPQGILSSNASVNDPLTLEGLPTSVVEAWADGPTKKTTYSYDSTGFTVNTLNSDTITVPYGKLISKTEYAYGAASAGPGLRKMETDYKALAFPAYLSSNFLDLKAKETITDLVLNGTRKYTYDYDSASTGNLSSSKVHLDSAGVDLETTYSYAATGELLTTTLPTDSATPSSTTTRSYGSSYGGVVPTVIKDALQHETDLTYDNDSIRLTSVKDANAQITSYTYYDDGRLKSISYPDGGGRSYSYPSANEVDETVKFNITSVSGVPGSVTTKTLFDGLGRKVKTIEEGTCSGHDTVVATTYDLMDRVLAKSNPYCSNAASSTILWTYFGSKDGTLSGYDSLGRTVLVTNPDGTTRSWAYNDRTVDAVQDSVTSSDEASHSRSQVTDALGRLAAVIEPGGRRTDYGYDAFGQLTSVNQAGTATETARTRSFSYDSLGRLTSASNPESGTLSYLYDNHNNVTKKSDPRGMGILYTYDALNRLKTKAYFGPTWTDGAVKTYYYDGQRADGATAGTGLNQVGRLSSARSWAPFGNHLHDEYQGYDSMGRLTGRTEVAQSESGSAGHSLAIRYDLAGHVTHLTYPDGSGVTQTYDAGGRLYSVTGDNGAGYVNSVNYHPSGVPSEMHFSNNNMGEYTSLNSRLQVCETSIGNGGGPGTLFNRQYFYGTDATSGNQCADAANNNGNILHVLDSMNSNNSQHYSYDDLNRLTQWKSGSGSNPTPRQSFGYDSFGNMVQAAGGTAPDASSAFGSDNRFSSSLFHCKDLSGSAVSYDSAGNLLCTGDPTTASQLYGFNEESELVLMWSQHLGYAYGLASQYSFDSSGQRVRADQWSTNPGETDWTILPASEHASWREYTYLNGQMLAEKDQNGHWTDYIYANGKRIARVQQVKPMLHIHGVRTQASVDRGCGQNFWLSLGSLPSYTVSPGDRLAFSQFSTLARGGLAFHFSNDTWMSWETPDQEGNPVNFGQGDGQWHTRIANVPQWAVGATIAGVVATTEHQTGVGTYDTWIAEAAIVSADGAVFPLYHGQPVGTDTWGACDSNTSVVTETISVDGQVGSTYYATDQVGTATMAFADDAWPIQRSEFAPFGQEITDPGLSDNRYKFTGKERDTESGLDYFGARFYGSALGRFISSDPVLISRDLSDPQSWNKYSYSFDRPLVLFDSDGKWPTYVHERILDEAFGKVLNANQLYILKRASAYVDRDQSPQGSYKHSLRSGLGGVNGLSVGGQTQAEARYLGEQFIDQNLKSAVDAQLRYESRELNVGLLSPDALWLLGEAIHTATDGASPWHEDYADTWAGFWNPLGSAHHGLAELTMSDFYHDNEEMAVDRAKGLLNQFNGMLQEQRKDRRYRANCLGGNLATCGLRDMK